MEVDLRPLAHRCPCLFLTEKPERVWLLSAILSCRFRFLRSARLDLHASPIWTPRSALLNMHASDVRPPALFIRPAISLRFSAGAFPFVGPAYGSAEPDGGELGLHGVVFTLSKADWAKVQLTEAAGLSYSVEPVTVKTYDGDLVESLTLRAMHPFRVPEGLQGSISRPSERYSNSLPSFPVPPHPPPTHDVIISLVMVMHLIWCCCCCCCDR
jgi:hypothetical protein